MHTQIKRLVLTLAALTPLVMFGGSPASAACGDGWNVDRYGRCFPAYLDNRPQPRYYGHHYGAPRHYYRARRHYAPYGYYHQPRYKHRPRGSIHFRF
jgi:hypothetical protein